MASPLPSVSSGDLLTHLIPPRRLSRDSCQVPEGNGHRAASSAFYLCSMCQELCACRRPQQGPGLPKSREGLYPIPGEQAPSLQSWSPPVASHLLSSLRFILPPAPRPSPALGNWRGPPISPRFLAKPHACGNTNNLPPRSQVTQPQRQPPMMCPMESSGPSCPSRPSTTSSCRMRTMSHCRPLSQPVMTLTSHICQSHNSQSHNRNHNPRFKHSPSLTRSPSQPHYRISTLSHH